MGFKHNEKHPAPSMAQSAGEIKTLLEDSAPPLSQWEHQTFEKRKKSNKTSSAAVFRDEERQSKKNKKQMGER